MWYHLCGTRKFGFKKPAFFNHHITGNEKSLWNGEKRHIFLLQLFYKIGM